MSKLGIKNNQLSRSELEIIKKSFDLYDVNHTGKANIKEMISTLNDCGYAQKNPILFKVFTELDTPEAEKNGGITFFDLIDTINKKLLDKSSDDALRNLYSIFVDDTKSIRKETLKDICQEIGKEYNDEKIQESLNKLMRYGNNLSYEEFASIVLNED